LVPSLALLFLYFFPDEYRQLFLWAFIPGIAAIIVTFLIKEKRKETQKGKTISFIQSILSILDSSTDCIQKINRCVACFYFIQQQ
jgi:hypothetical protein